MPRIFNVLTPPQVLVHTHRMAAANPDALGLVVKLDANGKLVPTSGSADQAFGIVVDTLRWYKYRHPDNSVDADEPVTVARGHFTANLNADCYTGTPAVGHYVVPDANGKVTFVASRPAYYIGIVEATDDNLRQNPGFGVPDAQLVRVAFHID
jgi:hypothetical protein